MELVRAFRPRRQLSADAKTIVDGVSRAEPLSDAMSDALDHLCARGRPRTKVAAGTLFVVIAVVAGTVLPVSELSTRLQVAGLALDAVGVLVLAWSALVAFPTAVELGRSRWNGNLNVPAELLRNRLRAEVGLLVAGCGFAIQIAAAVV